MDNGNLNFEAQEMETDNDHATLRHRIAMVQIIVFIEYTLTQFLLIGRNIWLKNCGKLSHLV